MVVIFYILGIEGKGILMVSLNETLDGFERISMIANNSFRVKVCLLIEKMNVNTNFQVHMVKLERI